MSRPTVVFVCQSNQGKSQMAASLARLHAGDAVEVVSAGTKPKLDGRVNPESATSLAALGASVEGEHPKGIDADLAARADRVVILGSNAQLADAGIDETSLRAVERWDTDEPSLRGIDGAERMDLIRDDIDARVRGLLTELGVEPRG